MERRPTARSRGEGALRVNFETETYEGLTPLEVGRWYPTAVTGRDGRVVIVSGLEKTGITTNVTEVFDPATSTRSRLTGLRKFPLYPRFHLAANGRFFFTGPSSGSAGSVSPGFWNP